MYHVVLLETERVGGYDIDIESTSDMKVHNRKPYLIAIKDFSQKPTKFTLRIRVTFGNLSGYINIESDLDNHGIYTFPVYNENGVVTQNYSKFDIQLVSPPKQHIQNKIDIKFPNKFSIGHRGFGMNAVSKSVLENSLAAFEKGFKSGCNFVEFDIQLSKDNVPVIFHDWTFKSDHQYHDAEHVRTTGNSYEYAINQLTLKQFKKSGMRTEYKTPHCSFKEMLTELPVEIPFDIEVKSIYEEPHLFKDIPYPNRDYLIDLILDDLEKYGNGRRLFFSSFDPMTIIMLHLKQVKWPILQLSCKEDFEDDNFALSRLTSLVNAHRSIGIDGFVLDSDLVFKYKDLISEITNSFMLCTYGKFNNTETDVRQQFQMGVRGICTDTVPLISEFIHNYA